MSETISPQLVRALIQLLSAPQQAPASALAAQGRNGDTMLAHVNPHEAQMLKARGGAGTVNPRTGLAEFYDGPEGGGGQAATGAGAGGQPGATAGDQGGPGFHDFGMTSLGPVTGPLGPPATQAIMDAAKAKADPIGAAVTSMAQPVLDAIAPAAGFVNNADTAFNKALGFDDPTSAVAGMANSGLRGGLAMALGGAVPGIGALNTGWGALGALGAYNALSPEAKQALRDQATAVAASTAGTPSNGLEMDPRLRQILAGGVA